jgi:protein-S-isoprenylcysteine O-methyltransferase Ste14
MSDLLIRIIALGIFFYWTTYWLVTGKMADEEKPKIREIALLHRDNIRKMLLRAVQGVLILQLLGLSIFAIENGGGSVQVIGLIMVIIGASISITARRELGTNWAHAFEYQVKQQQTMVTSGIYKYIRHPIYTGIILGFIGGELVAKSYLALLGIVLIIGAYHQAKLEEKLLLSHYKESYRKYINKTRMFIPYLW